MALENREGGQFITIFQGKFSIRADKSVEGAVSRINKKGNEVWEKHYTSFTARLTDIRTVDTEYGKNWAFSFVDGAEEYVLRLPYSNSYATAFLKMLPNIDLSKPMKLQPAVKMVDGVNRSSLFVSQDGQTIKHAYTKDVPNGLPPMKQIVVKGQTVWDDTDRIEFLHDMVMTTIVPKLSGGKASGAPVNPVDAGLALVEPAFPSSTTPIATHVGSSEEDDEWSGF